MHYIPTQKTEAAILTAMHSIMNKSFLERVREASNQSQENAVKAYRQNLGWAQKRHKELNGLVKKLHEETLRARYPTGILPACWLNTMRNKRHWKPL
jgi:site-specific DNA recombinase